MLKGIPVVLFLIFSFENTRAQSNFSVGISGGLIVGKSSSNLELESNYSFSNYFALPLQFTLNENFILLSELSLIQKPNSFADENFESKIILKYIELPLLVKTPVLKKEYYTIHTLMGIYGARGREMVQRIKEENSPDDISTTSFENSTILKRYDYGFILGFQGNIGIGGNELFMDMKYGMSHANLFNDEGIFYFNHGLRLGMGMLFKIK